MRVPRRVVLALAVGVLATGTVFAVLHAARPRVQAAFPHEEHANLFPLCSTCHAGIVDHEQPIWPAAASCSACHDGVVEPRVEWAPRAGPPPSNLRFTHDAHHRAVSAQHSDDSSLVGNCAACHNEAGAPRMFVQRAVVQQCLDCHGLQGTHFEVASGACATCHVPLTQAPLLTVADISRFPRPASHDAPDFLTGGHGRAAATTTAHGTLTVAASCATCHSRNLCVECHVNAPESPVVQALAPDPRAPAFVASRTIPASHAAPGFLRNHGRDAQSATATCATCHTRESCTTCHIDAAPRAIAALPVAGPGRAAGAQLMRRPPPSHSFDFAERHGSAANARLASCETCHTRSSCLDCHRPENARVANYHPSGFLTRHPSAAYSRDASCSECHNAAQFCQDCHQRSGLTALARLGRTGYHDAFRGFSLGHGQAARQSLETCVACHIERDCTACHSAVGGGFRFSPHGPGFNAARARASNPSMCAACHGTAVPGSG